MGMMGHMFQHHMPPFYAQFHYHALWQNSLRYTRQDADSITTMNSLIYHLSYLANVQELQSATVDRYQKGDSHSWQPATSSILAEIVKVVK